MTQEPSETLLPVWIISRSDHRPRSLYRVVECMVTRHSHQDVGQHRQLGRFPTLRKARQVIPPYAVCMPRDQHDPPGLIESWI